MSIKLRNLLLILVIVGTTRCYPQPASNKICLTEKQFDYYALVLVQRNSLLVDTSVLGARLLVFQKIIFQKDAQLKEDSLMFVEKDRIIKDGQSVIRDLSKDLIRANKKFHLWRQGGLGLAGVVLILFLAILFK